MSEIKLGTNILTSFRGAKSSTWSNYQGKEQVCLDVLFANGFKHRFFDPADFYRKKKEISETLRQLVETLGGDYYEIPRCHSWEEFTDEIEAFTAQFVDKPIYIKLVQSPPNKKGQSFPRLGEGRCFSTKPDLELTENDRQYFTPVEDSKIDEVDMPI